MIRKYALIVVAVLASLLIGCGQAPQTESSAVGELTSDAQIEATVGESESEISPLEQDPHIITDSYNMWMRSQNFASTARKT